MPAPHSGTLPLEGGRRHPLRMLCTRAALRALRTTVTSHLPATLQAFSLAKKSTPYLTGGGHQGQEQGHKTRSSAAFWPKQGSVHSLLYCPDPKELKVSISSKWYQNRTHVTMRKTESQGPKYPEINTEEQGLESSLSESRAPSGCPPTDWGLFHFILSKKTLLMNLEVMISC